MLAVSLVAGTVVVFPVPGAGSNPALLASGVNAVRKAAPAFVQLWPSVDENSCTRNPDGFVPALNFLTS